MILRRDDAFKAVCEFRTPQPDGSEDIGTGMFVATPTGEPDKSFGWIVTATHVARGTTIKTNIVESLPDGRSAKLPLQLFANIVNWKHHPEADISCLQIVFTPINTQFVKGHLFPYDHFHLERTCVSRDAELTSIGFPQGLGADGFFSPFTFRSFASSGFVTMNRADTHTPCTFFCLENPSVGGYSGCPVFDLGYSINGMIQQTKDKTRCYGFMHGTIKDNTGGKIAMVTPAFYLKDLIG